MAKVYVGTYAKYNNGNLKGAWLDLANYETYDDFLKACKELHKDESDPEYMIQDNEGFPDGLDCMEWIGREDFDDIKLAMKEEQQESEGKPSINIINYSEKAFAVVGDTKAVKDALKKMGGSFNTKLSCGAGWIFPNSKRGMLEKFIASGEVAEAVRKDRKPVQGGKKFEEWLSEYVAIRNDEYYRKNNVGAIKFGDRFYLIEKPSIENRFCFHDEGPQYEFYKSLMSDDKKLQEYFLKENLHEFDEIIEHITKGDERRQGDKRVWWYEGNEHRMYIALDDYWDRDGNYKLLTEDEKKLLLAGVKFGREMFSKRLQTYLKRYGTSKLHTWTYWADR